MANSRVVELRHRIAVAGYAKACPKFFEHQCFWWQMSHVESLTEKRRKGDESLQAPRCDPSISHSAGMALILPTPRNFFVQPKTMTESSPSVARRKIGGDMGL